MSADAFEQFWNEKNPTKPFPDGWMQHLFTFQYKNCNNSTVFTAEVSWNQGNVCDATAFTFTFNQFYSPFKQDITDISTSSGWNDDDKAMLCCVSSGPIYGLFFVILNMCTSHLKDA